MKPATLVLAAIPSAALAALAALVVAGMFEDAAPGPGAGNPAAVRDSDPPGAGDAGTGDAGDGDAASDAPGRRPGRRAVRVRAGAGRVTLDPALTSALSSADVTERERAALTLLERGTEILDALHYVQPKTKEGAVLLSKMEIALETLRRIERGSDYPRLDEESRLGLRLKFFGEVLPPSALVPLRRAYWQQRVASNGKRLAIGGVTPDEAALDELELARAQFDAGEATPDEWRAAREKLVPAAARHVAAVAGDRTKPADAKAAVAARLARLDRE